MSEMIEQMLAGALGVELDRVGYGWAGKRALCRLMIEAMREPTAAMMGAAQQINNLCEEAGHFEFLSRDEMTAAWQAGIDEALK